MRSSNIIKSFFCLIWLNCSFFSCANEIKEVYPFNIRSKSLINHGAMVNEDDPNLLQKIENPRKQAELLTASGLLIFETKENVKTLTVSFKDYQYEWIDTIKYRDAEHKKQSEPLYLALEKPFVSKVQFLDNKIKIEITEGKYKNDIYNSQYRLIHHILEALLLTEKEKEIVLDDNQIVMKAIPYDSIQYGEKHTESARYYTRKKPFSEYRGYPAITNNQITGIDFIYCKISKMTRSMSFFQYTYDLKNKLSNNYVSVFSRYKLGNSKEQMNLENLMKWFHENSLELSRILNGTSNQKISAKLNIFEINLGKKEK